MKIFWSWQSDTPGKTGRYFVRDALSNAIKTLKEPEPVQEPNEREVQDALHLDHDRQGVTGSPDLASTIMKKIEESAVFVADVTPVATIPAVKDGDKVKRPEKRIMNPNVAIELGYALKAVTSERVLMVVNDFYGGREFLPFDLAHKGGPIFFTLAPDADKATQEKVAKELTNAFVRALRPFLKQEASEPELSFPETPPTITRAAYFKPGEALAEFGEPRVDLVSYSYPDGNGFYLRVIPSQVPDQPFLRSEIQQVLQRADMWALWRDRSDLYAANDQGAAVVEPESINGGALKASTQVFSNGELWGFARWPLMTPHNLLATRAIETLYRNLFPRYLDFMGRYLQIPPPYTVEVGVVGIKGKSLAIGNDEALSRTYAKLLIAD